MTLADDGGDDNVSVRVKGKADPKKKVARASRSKVVGSMNPRGLKDSTGEIARTEIQVDRDALVGIGILAAAPPAQSSNGPLRERKELGAFPFGHL